MRYDFGGLIFGGAYTWRGLFSEFYGNAVPSSRHVRNPSSGIQEICVNGIGDPGFWNPEYSSRNAESH